MKGARRKTRRPSHFHSRSSSTTPHSQSRQSTAPPSPSPSHHSQTCSIAVNENNDGREQQQTEDDNQQVFVLLQSPFISVRNPNKKEASALIQKKNYLLPITYFISYYVGKKEQAVASFCDS